MYSLHLTGNPWFLLLIPPGLWILWRQYRGPAGASGPPRAGVLLFALQALALILLAFSLTAPELRRHKVEFHNPAILILRDQSGSFRDGAYLGLGARYRDFEKALESAYGAKKFDVRVADFAERAWPVRGFSGSGAFPAGRQDGNAPDGDLALTSLAAPADFLDSAAVPNLQAVFLFSDGRPNLDSGRAPPNWRIPVYPVVFPPDSIAEVQPEYVRMSADAAANAGAGMSVDAAWRKVGKTGGDAVLKILQGNRILLTRKLPAKAIGTGKDTAGKASGAYRGEAENIRFAWSPDRPLGEGRMVYRAVIQPADPAADFDPYNDTLGVAFPRGRAVRNIHVLRPIRSLDEKAMLSVLQSWEGTRVSFFGAEDAGRLALTADDQVWVEAGTLASQSRLPAWLQATPAKVVIYSRSDSGRNPQLPGLANAQWRTFTPAAEIKVGKAAAEPFPDEAVRLKSLTPEAVNLPEAPGAAWVELLEGGKRGMLMGRIDLGRGKHAFYFALPSVWAPLFDPQGDFAVRENVDGYVKAAQALAAMEDGAVRVSRPSRAFEGVPFEVDARVPEKPGSEKGKPARLVLSISGGDGFSKDWPQNVRENGGEFAVKDVILPRGKYRLDLKRGDESLWSDSLEAAPKAALELARIGFDHAALQDAASRSGGAVLAPPDPAADPDAVTSMLPNLPAAQRRMEKTSSIRLYNTYAQCVLVLLLLSLSWLLRKKWDMD